MLSSIDTTHFTVFDIPPYFFFTLLGLVVSISTFVILVTIKKFPIKENLIMLFISLGSMVLFAKLFGCISGIYRDMGLGEKISWDGIKNTGIVFYGGLIGLLISYSICTKLFKQEQYGVDILAVCIPLFHAITRVGCFFGGCCFGKEYDGLFSVNYTTKVFNEVVTSQRIPIQLIEAMFNLGIFFYLLFLFRKDNWKEKHLLRRYLLIYSIGRFLFEFLRGDIVRGVVCGVSFSQIISILIWIYLISTYKKTNVKEEMAL